MQRRGFWRDAVARARSSLAPAGGGFPLLARRRRRREQWERGLQAREREVTELRDALADTEQRLRTAERRLHHIVTASLDLVCTFDTAGIITFMNPAVRRILGYAPDDLLGTNAFGLVHPDDRPYVLERFAQQMAATDDPRGPGVGYRALHADGSWLPMEARGRRIDDDQGRPAGMVLVARDMVEHHELRRQLEARALHDPLTGLPNRVLFFDRLSQAIAGLRRGVGPLAVMYLDLDGFKGVNDHLGHTVGDSLLKAVAERLAGCLRQTDTAARFGGDEFTVLVERLGDSAHADHLAQRILTAFAEPLRVDDHELTIGVSIGLVVISGPADGIRPDDLVKSADRALYRAKADGRARVVRGLVEIPPPGAA